MQNANRRNSNKAKRYRQGDVLVVPVDALPKDLELVARDGGRVVLAYGERSGHAHAIMEPGVQLYRTGDGGLFLTIEGTAVLKHEEHGPLSLSPGIYRVILQREYSPPPINMIAEKSRPHMPNEDEFERLLLEKGLIAEIKPAYGREVGRREFHPVPVRGKPVSETIVEDRR